MEHLSAIPESLRQPDGASALNTYLTNAVLSRVDPDRREQAVKQMGTALLQNRPLQEIMSASQISGILHDYEYAHKHKRKVYVKARLSGSEQLRLSTTFCHFNLDFSRADDSGCHAFARAHRILSAEKFRYDARITDHSVPAPGYDTVYKDIGGNPVSHLTQDHFYCHPCAPTLCINDGARKARYHNYLRSLDTAGMSKETALNHELHAVGDGRVVCGTVAEHCHVKAPVLFFIHSVYDIRLTDIAQMMYNSDAYVAYGCFIFDVIVLYQNEGELTEIGCCFKRFRRNGRVMIRFWFPNDPQLGYEHDFLHYVEIVNAFVIKHETRYETVNYFCNITGIHDNVAFFEILRNTSPVIPASRAFRVLTDRTLNDVTVINYWHFDTLNSNVVTYDVYDRMVPSRLMVPTTLFDNLVTYAFNLPESKFTVKNIVCAATSLNNRFVTNGAVVKSGPKIPPFELQKLAHAVFLLVYISTFECSQALMLLLKQEANVRELSEASVVRRVWANMRQRVRGAFSSRSSVSSDNVRLPDTVEETIDAAMCPNTTFLKRFVSWFAEKAKVRRLLNVDVQQNFVKYFTVEAEIGTIIQDVRKTDRLMLNDSLIDLDPYKAMLSSLRDENGVGARMLDITACNQTHCLVKTRKILNTSSGHCVIQSFIDSGVPATSSIMEVRNRLAKSSYLDNFNHCPTIREYLCNATYFSDLSTVDVFPPAVELLMLIALEYRIGICTHIDKSRKNCYRFSSGDVYHFHIANSHCSFLDAWHELPETAVHVLAVTGPDTYDVSHAKSCELKKVGELANTYAAVTGHDRLVRLQRALKLADPESVMSNFGYRTVHGVISAEACIRSFTNRLVHSHSTLVVGATATQLEAVLTTVNGFVHYVPGLPTCDVREFSSERRLIQYNDIRTDGDLTEDSSRIHVYLAIISKNPTGLPRVFCGNLHFRKDYIQPDNDKYFAVAPVNLHFCLSLLRIGGTACFLLSELMSERANALLAVMASLFTKVTISRLTMAQTALWVFSVTCEGYNGEKKVRDSLLTLSTVKKISQSLTPGIGRYVDACHKHTDRVVNSAIEELNNVKRIRFFRPDVTAFESSVGSLMSNQYTGTKALTSAINRPSVRARGSTLDSFVASTLFSVKPTRERNFSEFANVNTFDPDFDAEVPYAAEVEGLPTLAEKCRTLRNELRYYTDGDPSVDYVRGNRVLAKTYSRILGRKLFEKVFGVSHKLACATDTYDLGISAIVPTGIIEMQGNEANQRRYVKQDLYTCSDSEDDSDDDDEPSATVAASTTGETSAAPRSPFDAVAADLVAPAIRGADDHPDAGLFDLIGIDHRNFDGDIFDAVRQLVTADANEETASANSSTNSPPVRGDTSSPVPELVPDDSASTDSSSTGGADDMDAYEIPPAITVKVSAPSKSTLAARSLVTSMSAAAAESGRSVHNGTDTTPSSALAIHIDGTIPESLFVAANDKSEEIQAAVDEYRNMLLLVHSAHLSNLSRVYNRYASGSLAVVSKTIEALVFQDVPKDSVVIPHAKDFGVIDRKRRWVIKPQSATSNRTSDYKWYFDGKSIVPFPGLEEGGVDPFETKGVGNVVVNNYCMLALDGVTYEAVKNIDVSNVKLDNVNFVQAVPGAGKTTYIINGHIPFYSADPDEVSNVILCTSEGKEDFHARMIEKSKECKEPIPDDRYRRMKQRYVTLASFLINNRKVKKSDSLFIDEAFMHHPGALLLAIAISGASNVQILGDCKQIPYVNRLESFTMRHGDLNSFVKPSVVLNKSYRCPVDVAMFLSDVYSDDGLVPKNDSRGMISARPVATRSMSVKKFNGALGLAGVPKDTQVLTFTQSCKTSMLNAGFIKVNTIHEFQGKQAAEIVLIRDTETAEDRLPNDQHYLTVGVSRHTQSFTYFTKLTNDKLASAISRFYNKTTDYSSHLDTTAGSVDFRTQYMGVLKMDVAPNSFKTFNRRDPNGKKYSCRLRLSIGPCASIKVTKTDSYRIVDLTVGPVRSARSLRAAAPLLREFISSSGVRELDLEDDCFTELQPLVVSSILYQFVGKECKYYRNIGDKYDETPFEVFDALNRNAICDVPNTVDLDVPTLHEFVDRSTAAPAGKMCISELQLLVDDSFHASAYTDQSFDSWQVHHYDLDLSLGDIRIVPHRGLYESKRYDNVSPVLKTPIPHVRTEFTAELLVALQKRNCNVPECQGIVDVDYVSTRMLDDVVAKCLDWDTMANVLTVPINVSANEVCEWLKNQPTSVVDQIVGDFALHDSPLNEYLLSIKAVAKPVLKRDADESYAPLQTILYHNKFINAIFCPIFREIKARLHKCLRSNLKVFSDVSMKDFEEILDRDVGDGPFALFSGDDSLIYNGKSYLEVDISKYDKSQGDLALEYELKYMRLFGVPEYFIELWRNAHVSTVARSLSTGVKISVDYQRKSGDASTFLGNTLFLIGVLASVIPFDDLGGISYDDYMDSHVYNYVFNLEVKFFRYKVPYFCSKFLIRRNHGWKMVPDPVKLVCKLGRHDLINEYHVECYRVSLADHLEGFTYDEVCNDVSEALVERYKVTADYTFTLSRLSSITDKDVFSQLFEILPGSNIDRTRTDFCMRD